MQINETEEIEPSFIWYRSFFEAGRFLAEREGGSKADAYDLWFAVQSYALDGKVPDEMPDAVTVSMIGIMPQVDANKKRRRDGKKGGRPPKENSEEMVSPSDAMPPPRETRKKSREDEKRNELANLVTNIGKGANLIP